MFGSKKERSDRPRSFFSDQEQRVIVASIEEAETNTSGEIRFHVERDVPTGEPVGGDAYMRARQVFDELGMHRTAARNGVLVYLATRSRRFAVVGDEYLHQKVGEGFWDEVILAMKVAFGDDRFGVGIAAGIVLIGDKLKEFFPWQSDDVNELADDISFGDD